MLILGDLKAVLVRDNKKINKAFGFDRVPYKFYKKGLGLLLEKKLKIYNTI